jgi:RNA polymerase sigma factor (sigma-70 family)
MPALIGRADPMECVGQMFREIDGALRRFLRRRLRCPDDADDLAQEVYLRMSRHPDLRQVDCLKTFAYQTALNLVRDRSRRAYTRSRRHTVSIDSIELAGGVDPLDHALYDERLQQIEGALAVMSPPCREALLMHRFDDVTYAEVARSLGVSVSMIEKYISAALVELRHAESPSARSAVQVNASRSTRPSTRR